ncbi:hypothetical protein [Cytobacillus kochii]|uniref:hypothetical protein n=1 Tax=Cytobacillus kochii TaxID=859143 RepID=UPI0025A06FBE|nr:hypothetical protein [Cytobacillus kochii]MDM5205317.1 hypothetical protein [Cytobacillus kochii]
MKKSYSEWDILQKKLSGAIESTNFFSFLMNNRKYITITLPYYEYLRGKVFIEDMRDTFPDEVPFQFDMGTLLYMLYDDFLMQIKKGAPYEQIVTYLANGERKYFQKKTKQKRIMKPLTKHVFEFQTVEDELDTPEEREGENAYLEIRMKESEILRGEILLHDLSSMMKDIIMTVEEMIAIIYLDFIEHVKNVGNSARVQKSILMHIK